MKRIKKNRLYYFITERIKNIQLLLIVLFLFSSVSFYGQESDTLKTKYIIGLRNNNEPFEFLDENDQLTGLTVDLLNEIAKSANISFTYVPMTYKQAIKALDVRDVDFIPYLITPDRAKKYSFSTPYCLIYQALFQSSQQSPVTFKSIKGHKIGFNTGDRFLDTFAIRHDFEKHILKSKFDGFLYLKKGQIDAFFYGEQHGIQLISEYNFNNIVISDKHLFPGQYAFATNKENKKFVQLLSVQIAKLKASGKLKELNDKWLSDKIITPSWFKVHQEFLIIALSVFVFIIIMLIFWNWLLRSTVEEKTKSIKESEAKYRDLIDNSPDAIAIYVDGIIVLVNNECLRLMQAKSIAELLGRNVIEFIHPDFRAIVIEKMKQVALNDTALTLAEEKFIRLDGTLVDVEVKAMPIIYEHRQAVQLIVRDITKRKLTEELLERNRKEFIELFDHAPIGYHEIDAKGRIVRINETECNMLGYKAEELIGKYFWLTITEELISRKAIEAKLSGANIPIDFFEREFRKKDGTLLSVLVKDRILKNADGEITGIRTTVEDITEIKIAREKLENERLLLRTVIDNIPDAIYAKDLQARKTLTNLADIHNIGVENEEEVLGKTDFELFPTELSTKFFEDDTLVLKSKKSILNREEYVVDDNGNVRWLLTSKLPLFDKDNQLIGLVGIGRDITEQKLALETLENERLLLRTVIDNIPDPIYAKDMDGKKTLANMAEVELLGAKSESEVLNKDDFAFYPKEVAKKFKLREQELLQTGVADLNTEDFRFDDKGNNIWLLSSKIPLRDKNGKTLGIVGIGRNITTRKKMEESLRDSEELYRNLVEKMPEGVYKSTHDGKFINVNPAMVKLFGFDSKEELLNVDIKNQLYIEPADRDRLILEQDLMDMGIFKMKKKDGSEIWVEDHCWYSKDTDNNILFHEGVMRDITDRMKAELALKESKVELKNFAAHLQSVREEERLMLANEIHDEIGQVLIAIKIDMGLLKQKTLKEIDVIQSKDILPKFEGLLGLLDQTINTTRKIMTDNRHEVLHLMGFIESVKLQLTNFQEKYQISCRFESEIEKLELNPQQSIALFRILQESLSNVAKHAKATAVVVNLHVKDNMLSLEIKDNGKGFTDNQEIRKDAYGLISMRERAFLLDGELNIQSESGKGTSIKVEMPYTTIDEA